MILNERASKKSGETIKPKKKKYKTRKYNRMKKRQKKLANLSLPYNKFLYSKLFIVQLRNEYKICAAMDIHMSTQIKKALSRTLPSYLTSQNVVHSWRDGTTKKHRNIALTRSTQSWISARTWQWQCCNSKAEISFCETLHFVDTYSLHLQFVLPGWSVQQMNSATLFISWLQVLSKWLVVKTSTADCNKKSFETNKNSSVEFAGFRRRLKTV